MKNRIEIFLEDMTYNTRFEFLEEAKSDELKKIAEKRGIKLPAHDLAIFKGRYAYIDRRNKNNCTLPKEEVEKALDTINGKAIDFDHLRKRVVGYWIDASIEKDEIISYGIFFKGNFREDYQTIKELMQKDVLAISFEAYGNREFTDGDKYNLTDIEFAGGALLSKEKPAFPGSEVLEMANKDRVLEFAKIMTPPNTFVHTGEKQDVKSNKKEVKEVVDEMKDLSETARFHVWDIQGIMRLLGELDCLSCKEKGMFDPLNIDFENNTTKVKCINCSAELKVDLTPKAKLTKKGRKIKKVTALQDKAKIDKTEESKILRRARLLKMKKLLEQYKKASIEEVLQEIAKADINRELKAEEMDKVRVKIDGMKEDEVTEEVIKDIFKAEEIKKDAPANKPADKPADAPADKPKDKTDENAKKLDEAQKEIAKLKDDLKKATDKLTLIAKAEKDKLIKARKDELGEFAKDVSDEDILNDTKFENLKLKKYIADKEAGKDVKPPVDLTKGSVEKGKTDEVTKRNSIRDIAFGD